MSLQVRRGLNSAINSVTPQSGELIYTTDKKELRVGDGITAGGNIVGLYMPPTTVPFNPTSMTINCRLSNTFLSTFISNVTVAPTFSNPGDGQTIRWFITQDATGNRTIVWPTSFKWPAATPGVLSTAANSVDLLTATYVASTSSWYATLTKNFA
jgi:hypothetical protein